MRFTLNLPRAARVAAAGLVGVLMFATTASAQLLNFNYTGHPSLAPAGVTPSFGYPFIELTTKSFNAPTPDLLGSATYNGQVLTIKTYPQWVTFATAPGWFNAGFVGQAADENVSVSPCGFACGSFTLNAKIDAQTGQLVGVPTNTDVVFRGNVVLERWDPVLEMFFQDAVLNGTLLTGRVVDFAAVAGGGTGQFQFRVAVTGGLLTDPFGGDANGPWCAAGAMCYVQDPANLIQPGQDFGINVASSELTGTFAAGAFSGTAAGTAGTIAQMGAMSCYGIIGDRVWNDLNHNGIQDAGEPGIEGAGVTLRHPATGFTSAATTDATGNFWVRACPGENQIDVAGPQWYAASPTNQGLDRNLDSNGSGVIVNLVSGDVDRSVDFGFFSIPPISSAYTTFTDVAWGAKPKAGNAAKALVDYFPLLYPTGELIIGIPDTVGRYTVTVTGAAAVQTFLPQAGLPYKLDRNYVDPTHITLAKHKGKYKFHLRIGELAGNVMALRLNVDFSNFGLTRVGLANLKVKSGVYSGKTVGQILTMANAALAGEPQSSLLNYWYLNDAVERINKNFNAGTTNKGFLIQ